MDDLTQFCCQNSKCPDYGQRDANNLTVCNRYGENQRRMLRCRTCKDRFSERKGTVFWGAQLTEEKVVEVLKHVAEGAACERQVAWCMSIERPSRATVLWQDNTLINSTTNSWLFPP